MGRRHQPGERPPNRILCQRTLRSYPPLDHFQVRPSAKGYLMHSGLVRYLKTERQSVRSVQRYHFHLLPFSKTPPSRTSTATGCVTEPIKWPLGGTIKWPPAAVT